MSDREALERRLSAVERAIAGGDGEIEALAVADGRERRLDALEARVITIEETVTELEAATQALRGYVGNVRSVNRDVERRADAALAAVERLEGRLGEGRRCKGRPGEGRWGETTGTRGTTSDPDADSPRHLVPSNQDHGTTRDAVSTVGDPRVATEMPVPGARDGTGAADDVEPETNGDGVLDRVRDAL